MHAKILPKSLWLEFFGVCRTVHDTPVVSCCDISATDCKQDQDSGAMNEGGVVQCQDPDVTVTELSGAKSPAVSDRSVCLLQRSGNTCAHLPLATRNLVRQ